MRKAHIFALVLLTIMAVNINAQDAVPLEERIDNTLARMTTHEKIAVLHAQSKFNSPGVPRLGIRQLNMDDGPHGVREELEWNSWTPAKWTNDSVVAFPSLTCLAATWNQQLARAYGNAISEEFAYRGKDLILGPGANLARTPLNGRAFEYMGEDPLLAGEMAVNYIEAAQLNGVGCCMKHFVLNDQETDRFAVNVNVSERAMRELYLRPFEMAAKRAHVWSIMGSYNLWHDVHCCHNKELLCDILKDEWQWDGALVSDWGGTTDTWQAITGGLDIEMGTYTDGKLKESEFGYNNYYLADPFERLINEGKVPMEILDEKVRRVLRLIYRTSMNPQQVIGSLCSEAHYQTCREIAEEGITLLRNEDLMLPLHPSTLAGKQVLIVGENATRSLTQGGGSSELKTLRDISPLDGIIGVFGGIATVNYVQGYTSGRAIYDQVDAVDTTLQQRLHDEAIAAARTADLIIYIGGMNKNHRQDCENGDRENYNLSFGQDQLITELASIQPRIIVCTFGGNAYATPWLNKVAALVHCWYLGSEAGTALANVLTGKTNPSGKLPVTFAHCLSDYPSMMYGAEGYPGVNKQVYYKEGIFMGYRWFDLPSRNKKSLLKRNGSLASPCAEHTTFPFGYGLSYTTFSYGTPTINPTTNGWKITVPVTNTGEREGKETVQLYVGRKGKSAVERPVKELKDFAKVSLRAGETKDVCLNLSPDDLRYWDETTHAWATETGTYVAYICASSTDVRGQVQLTLK